MTGKGNIISPKEHIASIFKDFTSPSRLLQSFTNLSNTVIQTALCGQNKFLFEILQNADDAFEDQNQEIGIQFTLIENFLVIHHNGKGFDYNDVERICDYASQIEEVKATDLSKTGYKGLGFKSLFNISDCIYIYSGGYSFRFDKAYWPDSQSKPWQVIPIWCKFNELPLNKKFSYDHPVNFILKLNNIKQMKQQLKELKQKSGIFLFLHRINKISINMDNEEHRIERKIENFGLFKKVNFCKGQHVESNWIVRTYHGDVPAKTQALIQGDSKYIYPSKIKQAKEVPYTFALKIDKDVERIEKIHGLCYNTLPTQLHLNLPYHINSFFILNLDRTQLHEDEWNELLILQIGHFQLCLLRDLAEIPYLKYFVIEFLIRKISHCYASFNKAFLRGFSLSRDKICWLPSYQGSKMLKLSDGWIDETEFFKQNFENVHDDGVCPYLIDYELKSQCKLHEAKRFTYKQLFDNFSIKYYPQLTQKSYKSFIFYLYKKLQDGHDNNDAVRYLRNTMFLIGKDKKLYPPTNIFLEENNCPVPDYLSLNCIDNTYLPDDNIQLVKKWLMTLGVERLNTPADIIRRSVLNWIYSNCLKSDTYVRNHIAIIGYLAENFNFLTQREIGYLKNGLLVLAKSGKFVSPNPCYFPDALPTAELACIISDDEIISSSYNISHLRNFFISVGVEPSLSPVHVLRKTLLPWISNKQIKNKITLKNYIPIIEYFADNYYFIDDRLFPQEKIELKKLPILTLEQTFEEAQNCYFDSALPDVEGLKCIIAKNKLVCRDNLSKNIQTFLIKLGVFEAISLITIIRIIVRWIQRNKIRDKITESNYHGVIEYIAQCYFGSENKLTENEKGELKGIPILTDNKSFQLAAKCYFNSAVPNVCGLENIIPKKFLVNRSKFSCEVFNFLKIIGVKETLTHAEVVRKSILRWIKDGVIQSKLTENTYNDIIGYIASVYPSIKNELTKFEREELKRIPILTIDKSFQLAATCYFNSAVPNIKGLEDVIAEKFLINHITFPREVSDFLKEIGVKEALAPVEVIRKSILRWIKGGVIRNKITENTYNDIVRYIAKIYPSVENKLSNAEKEQLKQILVLTCCGTFNKAEVCYFNSRIPDVKGLKYIIAKECLVDDERLSEKVYNFLKKLGVSDTLSPVEIARKSILTWITNNEMQNKITADNFSDILNYFANHYYSIEENLNKQEMKDLKKFLIQTRTLKFVEVGRCYFSSAIPNVQGLKCVVDENYVFPVENISNKVKNFLVKLGITPTLTPEQILRMSVLKWIKEGKALDKITTENHYSIIEYTAEQWFVPGLSLESYEKDILKKIPILTKKVGTFEQAFECYLSLKDSDKIPGLESVISLDKIASPLYKSDKIRQFLQNIGVRKVKFVNIYEKYSDYLTNQKNIVWFFSQVKKYWKEHKMSAINDKLLQFLQQKFQSSPCLLGKNGKAYNSNELFCSKFKIISDIDPESIPLLDHVKLPEDLEEWLGFKRNLDLNFIVQLLKVVKNNPMLGRNRTYSFFSTLLSELRAKPKSEIKNYQLSLLSQDNELKPAKHLHYFLEEDAECIMNSCYLKRIEGMTHEQTLELAELCGVNISSFNKKIQLEDPILDNTLKTSYLEGLIYLALQESKYLNESPSISLKRLYRNVSSIELYQCSSIHVHYTFGNTETNCHFDCLKFYITGKWTEFGRKAKIYEHVEKHLCLKTDSCGIDMETVSLKNKEQWGKKDMETIRSMEQYLQQLIDGQINLTSDSEEEDNHPIKAVDSEMNSDYSDSEASSSESDTYDDSDDLTDGESGEFSKSVFVKCDLSYKLKSDNERNTKIKDIKANNLAECRPQLYNDYPTSEDYLNPTSFKNVAKLGFVKTNSTNKLKLSNEYITKAECITDKNLTDRQSKLYSDYPSLGDNLNLRSLKNVTKSVSSKNNSINKLKLDIECFSKVENIADNNSTECQPKQFFSSLNFPTLEDGLNPRSLKNIAKPTSVKIGSTNKLKLSSECISGAEYIADNNLAEWQPKLYKDYLTLEDGSNRRTRKNTAKSTSLKIDSTNESKLYSKCFPKIGNIANNHLAEYQPKQYNYRSSEDSLNLKSRKNIAKSASPENDLTHELNYNSVFITKHTTENKTQYQSKSPGDYCSVEASLDTVSVRILPISNTENYQTKRLAEEYIFTYLQNFCKRKYPKSPYTCLDNIFTLQWKPSREITITWLNKNCEAEQPYDILLEKDEEVKQVIKVKSTNVDWFNIGYTRFMETINTLPAKYKEKFCIYRVFNAYESPTVNIEQLEDTASVFVVLPVEAFCT